jgi:hypothetical protein
MSKQGLSPRYQEGGNLKLAQVVDDGAGLTMGQLSAVLEVLGLSVAVGAVEVALAGDVPYHHGSVVHSLLGRWPLFKAVILAVAQAVAWGFGPS